MKSFNFDWQYFASLKLGFDGDGGRRWKGDDGKGLSGGRRRKEEEEKKEEEVAEEEDEETEKQEEKKLWRKWGRRR